MKVILIFLGLISLTPPSMAKIHDVTNEISEFSCRMHDGDGDKSQFYMKLHPGDKRLSMYIRFMKNIWKDLVYDIYISKVTYDDTTRTYKAYISDGHGTYAEIYENKRSGFRGLPTGLYKDNELNIVRAGFNCIVNGDW